MSKNEIPAIDPVVARKRLGLNQHDFWSVLGVTQSGGSRYESGRTIPRPVRLLLALSYGTKPQREKALRLITPNKAGN